jgi:hypothetical protein
MAKVHYEKEDLIPLVMLVLIYTTTHLTMSAFKIALDNEFRDLKGSIDPEHFDQGLSDLVLELDDPLNLLIKEAHDEIFDFIFHLEMLHGIQHFELYEDKRICELADHFYFALSLYCPSNNRSKGSLGDLYCYTFCVDHIIYRLCETMIKQKRSFPRLVYKRWRSIKKVDFTDFNNCEQYEVRLLVNLGLKLDDLCDRIVDLTGKRRRKREGHVSRLVKRKKIK